MKTLSRRRFLSILPGAAPLLAMPRHAEDAPAVITNEELQEQIKYLRDKQRRDIADLREEQASIQRGNGYIWSIFDNRLDTVEECLTRCGKDKLQSDAKGEL